MYYNKINKYHNNAETERFSAVRNYLQCKTTKTKSNNATTTTTTTKPKRLWNNPFSMPQVKIQEVLPHQQQRDPHGAKPDSSWSQCQVHSRQYFL